MTFVVTKHRARLGEIPRRHTVNISSKPSRKLAAAHYGHDPEQVSIKLALWDCLGTSYPPCGVEVFE